MKQFFVLSALITLLILSSCATGPVEIEEELAPAEYFQKAQEAAGTRNDYRTALAYYEAFLERYPDNAQQVVEAEYEIAFIHYVQENHDLAEREFRDLLKKYEKSGAETLPQWPKVLAEKLLFDIQAKKETSDE